MSLNPQDILGLCNNVTFGEFLLQLYDSNSTVYGNQIPRAVGCDFKVWQHSTDKLVTTYLVTTYLVNLMCQKFHSYFPLLSRLWDFSSLYLKLCYLSFHWILLLGFKYASESCNPQAATCRLNFIFCNVSNVILFVRVISESKFIMLMICNDTSEK